MTTYCYRRLVSNEVGRIHWVCEDLEASSTEEAKRICRQKGWEFDGELIETIPAPELDQNCKDIQKQRDRDWVGDDS